MFRLDTLPAEAERFFSLLRYLHGLHSARVPGTVNNSPLSHGLVVHKLVMISYPNAELHNDPSNWWGPNPAAVIAMLKSVGFSRVKAWSYIARR